MCIRDRVSTQSTGKRSPSMARLRFSLQSLAALAAVACLVTAKEIEMATAAQEMVHLVHTKQSEAHVTLGDFVTKTATVSEKIGACFLDKVNHILEHDVVAWQPSHLAVDLAACCTIAPLDSEPSKACTEEITYP
eukprot:TRINITY_DN880_c0_g1_i4.p1 TRINITY_DN880_c0_g1~~TRINITY_DN880_c0_g1_i4.p1  ORF type:complete len:135 (-),score=25.17 TRINITY_DN880_c0_g1_i4:722-1126(-)